MVTTCCAITSQDLVSEIHNFVSGATYGKKVNSRELAKCAIVLLKTLPAAREAVLEHLCNVFDDAVCQHTFRSDLDTTAAAASTSSSNNGGGGQQSAASAVAPSSFDDSIINELHSVLSHFVTTNPTAWAPLISSWALALLGTLSSKYAGRRGMPHSSASLSELLQMWLTCRATRSLLDLSTQAIATLIGTNPDLCVDALLETSVQHSPNFDWVVAHIGSCFPKTIITRVLVCGLKDFCAHDVNPQTSQPSSLLSTADKKVPKLASVVGILGHLAAQHSDDIRKALLSLFHESFSPRPTQQQLATIPFLLQLASMSNMLLRVITTDFVTTLNADILNQLCEQIPQWQSSSVLTDLDSLASLVVHLVLGSEDGGSQVLQFLLNTAVASDGKLLPKVRNTCGLILDSLLLEMQRLVFTSCVSDVPLLHGLQQDVASFCRSVLHSSDQKTQWLLPILSAVGMQGGDRVGCTVLKLFLTSGSCADGSDHLWHFVQILRSLEASQPQLAAMTVDQVVGQLTSSSNSAALTAVLSNLFCLVKWEKGGKLLSRSSLAGVLQGNAQLLAVLLSDNNFQSSHIAAQIMSLMPPPSSDNCSLFVLAHVYRSVARHFFRAIQHNHASKLHQIQLCKEITATLSKQPAALYFWLRLLLEGLLNHECAHKFGIHAVHAKKRTWAKAFTLLEQNRKHAVTVTLPRSHSTVFHAGIIGKGPLPPQDHVVTSPLEMIVNRHLLIDLLQTACLANDGGTENGGVLSGADTLSLILVELVSPDVMFNGLPWPEDDFMKVTVERDLQIKRSFEDFPVLWLLLEFLAAFPPSLCFCSIILRALLSVTMTFWGSCQEKLAQHCPKQLELTCRVINIMAAGQLLPPPLCHVCELFPLLTPYELSIILSDVWRYMKDNIPSPNLFTKSGGSIVRKDAGAPCSQKYTYSLRYILQKNIRHFGKFYKKFFVASGET